MSCSGLSESHRSACTTKAALHTRKPTLCLLRLTAHKSEARRRSRRPSPAPIADAQNSSNKTSSQSSIDSSTKTQLADIEKAIKQNQDGVIKKIVERVVTCDPQMHPNLKKVEA